MLDFHDVAASETINLKFLCVGKTSVESVTPGRILELSMSLGLSWKYSSPCLIGLRVKSFIDHLILVRYAYIPNFRPLASCLHVKKFVVVGLILMLSFRPKGFELIKHTLRVCRQFLKSLDSSGTI